MQAEELALLDPNLVIAMHCIQCGWCCKALKDVLEAADLDNGNGECRCLDGNLCSVYNERPLVCNVTKMYEARFKDAMSEGEFVAKNY